MVQDAAKTQTTLRNPYNMGIMHRRESSQIYGVRPLSSELGSYNSGLDE